MIWFYLEVPYSVRHLSNKTSESIILNEWMILMVINKKYERTLTIFFSAAAMTFFISFVLVSINTGYNSMFFKAWMKTWSQAFICAYLAAYFLPKGIKYLMGKIEFVETET